MGDEEGGGRGEVGEEKQRKWDVEGGARQRSKGWKGRMENVQGRWEIGDCGGRMVEAGKRRRKEER